MFHGIHIIILIKLEKLKIFCGLQIISKRIKICLKIIMKSQLSLLILINKKVIHGIYLFKNLIPHVHIKIFGLKRK